PHTKKSAFLPNPSAFFLKPTCCLKNCDRGNKLSFSTVSATRKHWRGKRRSAVAEPICYFKRPLAAPIASGFVTARSVRKYCAKGSLDSKGREGLSKPVDVSEAPRQHRRVIAGCEDDGNVVGKKPVRQSEGVLAV
ncbi:MAG: hypothetical protein WBW81_01770, partial [Methylocella sp.]